MEKKRIGILMGSYDPIHIGHLSVAMQALNYGYVDEVRFLPAKQNPWKNGSTNFDARLEMIEAMIKGLPKMTFDASEILTKSNYAYDVIDFIKGRENDAEISIITTQETLNDIPNWYRGVDFLMENKFHIMDMPIPIHSTDIRNMIKEGKMPYPYINNDVMKIIAREKLYQE